MPQASGQMQKAKPDTKSIGGSASSWSTVFPEEVSTYHRSLLFTKKLIAVTISNITYIRCLFPESAYADRYLDGLALKVLKEHESCPGSNQIIRLLRGAFDALEKKYLRQLVLAVYTDEDRPNEIVESYTFEFQYGPDHVEMKMQNDKNSKGVENTEIYNATVSLIRTASVLVQTFLPLPDGVMLSMKLLYYDEVTPPDYQPEGFSPASTESYSFNGTPFSISAGKVDTTSHSLRLKIKTDETMTSKDRLSLVRNDTSNTEEMELEESINDDDQFVPVHEPLLGADSTESPAKPRQSEMSRSKKTPEVLCPCGINSNEQPMLTCGRCKTQQHAICFQVPSASAAPPSHVCDKCGTPSNPCTDVMLTKLAPEVKTITCLMRRTINVCYNLTRIQPSTLARLLGTGIEMAQALLRLLELQGFVKHPYKSKGSVRYLEKSELQKKGREYLTGSLVASPQLVKQAEEVFDISSDLSKLTVTTKKAVRASRRILDSQTDEYELCSSTEEVSKKRRRASEANNIKV